MIHALRSFSVKPLRNSENLSMSKVYPVLWVEDCGEMVCYVVRGNNGMATYIEVSEAIIEAEK